MPKKTKRPASKGDLVLAMLRAEKPIADILAATEWKPHTLRGFLSKLRKKLKMKIALAEGKYVITREGK